jgi:hypothetical protein
METLDREEQEASATIAEAGVLEVRLMLQHSTNVVGRGCPQSWLGDYLHSHQIDLISAPPDRF